MRSYLKVAAIAGAMASIAQPGHASTLGRLDLGTGTHAIGMAVVDASYDYAFSDTMVIGASAGFLGILATQVGFRITL
ncbi:MAG: hypothetical protein FJZ01_02740 [Candidatus Sericytochromatia bacterium]|nr:hypothetical protein [Candidatus Tanganyikabacteria bacterium]